MLMDPLVSALNGSQTLVSQVLRTSANNCENVVDGTSSSSVGHILSILKNDN